MAHTVRTLVENVGFAEGPVIRPGGEIVFVSISLGKVYEIRGEQTTVLADVRGGPNGATESADGLIYIAQNGGKWGGGSPTASEVTGGVQIVRHDGSIDWLTKDPISPNDLCFGPDGYLYVTDPSRFKMSGKDGRLFRCDVATGETELLFSVPWYTNGVAFGNDNALYIASSSEQRIVRYTFDGGRLGKGETYAKMPFGDPDGFLFDVEGNMVVGINSENDEPGQVQTYDRNGKLIDTFLPGSGKMYTNVALGPDRKLVICDSRGGRVLAVDGWPYAGLPLYPFRSR